MTLDCVPAHALDLSLVLEVLVSQLGLVALTQLLGGCICGRLRNKQLAGSFNIAEDVLAVLQCVESEANGSDSEPT